MQTIQPYKLILADDHILLRDALSNLIEKFDEFTVIARAADGAEVLQEIKNGCKPDLILMDLSMPNMDGYETSKWLSQNYPEIKIVILTMYDGETALIRLLRVGAKGFLKKDIHPLDLKRALLKILAGEFYYSNAKTDILISFLRNKSNLEKSLINEVEIEFLKLASTEMTYKEIALIMQITPRQIDILRDSLFFKLEIKSRVGLVMYAIKNGIVTL